jgi:hypothetical protein
MMSTNCLQVHIPLFDRMLRHPFIPASREVVTARNGGSRRYFGQCASTLPWMGTSSAVGWCRLGTILVVAAIMASSATVANGATATQVAVPSASLTTNAQNDPFAKSVDEAAHRYGIPAAWIHAVMLVESGGNPIAVSPKGAMGLMQIMPKTWADLRTRYNLGVDPFDPHDNILAGAAYLRELYDRFGEEGFLAAYNAGPTGFENYLAGHRPSRDETTNYLAKLQRLLPTLHIGGRMNAVVSAIRWQQATLFPTQPTADTASSNSPSDHSSTTRSQSPSFALTPQSSGMFVAIRTPPQ